MFPWIAGAAPWLSSVHTAKDCGATSSPKRLLSPRVRIAGSLIAQQHLRILSGLYGVLRPLDLMQAYRLEMGLKFANSGGKNLYEFWGDDITERLNAQLKKTGSAVLVNLASNEYFKAVKVKQLAAEVITPQFKEFKNGKYKIISFFAKKARGRMAAYMVKNRVTEAEEPKKDNSEA